MKREIEIERTKRGLPALWEKGGGFTNIGSAQIVTGPDGKPLKPIYIRRRGSLACGRHALLVVQPGCYVIWASHRRRDFIIKVLSIADIQEKEASCDVEYVFSRGEWDIEPISFLEAAIRAAKEKATCYHCRQPHYIAE